MFCLCCCCFDCVYSSVSWQLIDWIHLWKEKEAGDIQWQAFDARCTTRRSEVIRELTESRCSEQLRLLNPFVTTFMYFLYFSTWWTIMPLKLLPRIPAHVQVLLAQKCFSTYGTLVIVYYGKTVWYINGIRSWRKSMIRRNIKAAASGLLG